MPTDLPRILVIEDNPFIQKTYLRMLKGSAVVTMFDSGEEALQHLREFGTDMIICDQMLKGLIRGTDIYRHLREHHPQIAKRFLFITGSARDVSAILGEATPTLLEKPATCQEIAARVYETLKLT